MMHRLAALFVGMVTAILILMFWEVLSVRWFPPPEGTDLKDPEQLKAFVATLPDSAFWMMVAANASATIAGGLGACYLAKQHFPRMCGTIGASMFVLAIMLLTKIPYPTWFAAANLLGIVTGVFIALWLARRLVKPVAPAGA